MALGRVGDMFCLVHSSPPESDLTPPVWMNLSVLAHEDPFPGRNMNGQEMFWSVSKTLLESRIRTETYGGGCHLQA